MSLLNIRNFVIPLTSKTSLLAMVAMVIIFAVYRLSTGHLQPSPRGVSPAQVRPPVLSQGLERGSAPSPSVAPAQVQRGGDFLNQLLDEERPKEDAGSKSLRDIEEALGLKK